MVKKIKIITSVLALLAGLFIFGVSLVMASQIQSGNSQRVSEKKLYMGERILPDHVFYPLLMVADKIILETSSGNRRIYIKIKLADDRLYSAKMLLEKNQEELALSAMTKSQKYLITAAQDFLSSDDRSKSVRKDLLEALEVNSRELKSCGESFSTISAAPISNLLVESSILIDQLSNTN